MRRAVRVLVLYAMLCAACLTLHAGQATPPPAPPPSPSPSPLIPKTTNWEKLDAADAEMTGPANYDEVVHELVEQLLNFQVGAKTKGRSGIKARDVKAPAESGIADMDEYTTSAQDAARKLAQAGKRAVPELAMLFRSNYSKPEKGAEGLQAAQLTYYSAWALARIRTAEAAHALAPLLTNTSARADLRLIAVDAAGWEKSEDNIALLQKVAASDPDSEVRKRALSQLSTIPESWARSESIFVRALGDSNEEIRMQAAKACHFAHIFLTANPKLIELMEKDPSPAVRVYAMLTLARLKVRHAEPALVRILSQKDGDEKMRKQALTTLAGISGVPLRNIEVALNWWEKSGKEEYELFAANEKRADAEREGETGTLPLKAAPKFESADPGEIRPVKPLVNAEIIAPDELPAPTPFGPPRRNGANVEISGQPLKAEVPASVKVPDAPEALPGTRAVEADEKLSPSESTGSQRRRRRLAEQK